MKPDEREFLAAVAANKGTPRTIARNMGMNYKRACYLCQKWTDKGWYDYGVSVDLGWLTPEGVRQGRLDART